MDYQNLNIQANIVHVLHSDDYRSSSDERQILTVIYDVL